MPDDYPRLPQRRPALRSVPSTERYVARLRRRRSSAPGAASRTRAWLETLRKLWRQQKLIAGTAPSCWAAPPRPRLVDAVLLCLAEARVLVGVQSPRVLNVEAIITDVSPGRRAGAERRLRPAVAHTRQEVIDKLKLERQSRVQSRAAQALALGAPLRSRAASCRRGQRLAGSTRPTTKPAASKSRRSPTQPQPAATTGMIDYPPVARSTSRRSADRTC